MKLTITQQPIFLTLLIIIDLEKESNKYVCLGRLY